MTQWVGQRPILCKNDDSAEKGMCCFGVSVGFVALRLFSLSVHVYFMCILAQKKCTSPKFNHKRSNLRPREVYNALALWVQEVRSGRAYFG